MSNYIDKIKSGATTAFIDSTNKSSAAYKPEFISNNHTNGVKVLTSIEDELRRCDSFTFSVAFITLGGITPMLQTFQELERKGIPGRILTTDYNNFTDPKALDKLAGFKNIELRMYQVQSGENIGFHTKGYIFKKDETYTFIIGSANMTDRALAVNKEWNTKLVSTEEGEMYKNITAEFNKLWSDTNHTKSYDEFIEEYRIRYETIKKQKKIALQNLVTDMTYNGGEKNGQVVSFEQYKLAPNSMQVGFINNLRALIERGETKALLVSATGTGKTYASAFGLRDAMGDNDGNVKSGFKNNAKKSNRILFIVHREQIAKQAMKSYKNVFGRNKTYGLLSGNSRDTDTDILFATMQMMSKEEVMTRFPKDCFKTIVIDEAHRTGAASYQKIMEYFEPEFWLGMTASPERTDDFDVFATFDHNIALEIRLQQAMEENLLCPFHYFGITDMEIDGVVIDEKTEMENFRFLVSDKRVDYITQQMNFYGYSGDRVKGLIFCSSRKEAETLSGIFNDRGYKTKALTGADSQEEREAAIELLTKDIQVDIDGTKHGEYLDYIFTVDIFNEGVDIPEVNQVVMLRPTESPIVFVQQLGRGLRKSDDKDFVVILDFIANYKNNFMIPIALSGDRTYNKDNIRRYVTEGEKVIPGISTIHFDEISKKKIYAAIDTANFSDIKLIRENYKNLKYKLGRIPNLMDFDRYGEMDLLRIFDNNSLGSYYKFLVKYEKDYKVRLSANEEKIVEFISKKLASGKRIHELEMLSRMLIYKDALVQGMKTLLKENYNKDCPDKVVKSVVNVLTNEFPSGSGKKTYEDCIFIEKSQDGDFEISKPLQKMIHNKEFYDIVKELLEFGRYRYDRDYSKTYKDTELVLYQKYTYEDACRLLNWEHNEVPLNIGGYKYDKATKTFPVFINYDKSDDIQDTIKYEDHFTSRSSLIAISKQSRTVESEDVQNFLHAKERGIDVELFVRKNKDDKISKEFYYLGRMTATGFTRPFIMPNTDKTAVEIEWKLETPVREDIYQYIVNG
ncbi:Helicase conserved C-terminal domain-containing protein [Eubacterium ruminantium]|uniref:Helicase conserved C-terminal domain-containing protein n=1 Tax=Eubacterium ruminantium TaxID=42322 RepID=A0A1T4MB19_9FIRM|nr:DEAD/DEAH box helicase [Eubacterium ruminantium]SCW46726.1 Helicase conserved C-terminal domain-containing protein [Eubacterium ruminantium]SDM53276.1 Helicase conserved C-terminal domain-containing protein [Eubacterium ruminantium]SJZ64037.1 Helicase conserved C-terminal domain-containing protein [Eubacterium ruminantium]